MAQHHRDDRGERGHSVGHVLHGRRRRTGGFVDTLSQSQHGPHFTSCGKCVSSATSASRQRHSHRHLEGRKRQGEGGDQ